MIMKFIGIISIFIVFSFPLFAQINLVPDPGFEQYKRLPCIRNRDRIEDLLLYWNQPTPATTDYLHALTKNQQGCDLYPSRWNLTPHSGMAIVGLYLYDEIHEDTREYVQTQLSSPTVPGLLYYLEFYALKDPGGMTSNNLGLAFSDTAINITKEGFKSNLPLTPVLLEKKIITDDDGWVKISGFFEADDSYSFIVIGNFFTDEMTEFSGYGSFFGNAYYHIDDVSVIELSYKVSHLQSHYQFCYSQQFIELDATVEGAASYRWEDGSVEPMYKVTDKLSKNYWVDISLGEYTYRHIFQVKFYPEVKLGNDVVLCEGEGLLLKGPPGEAIVWSDGSKDPFKIVTEPGAYWLKTLRDNCNASDTIIVNFTSCPGIIPNVITPNGDGQNDRFVIEGIEIKQWELNIYNRWGTLIYYNANYDNKWAGEESTTGTYFYELKSIELNKSYKGWIEVLR
jgi:gliding motility-associated-like protein